MKTEFDGQLASVLTAYEQSFAESWKRSLCFRGIRDGDYQSLHYRDEAGNEYNFDLVHEITGKVAGDVGSGGGGLATTAALEEIDTEIWSIHPNMDDERFIEWQPKQAAGELSKLYLSSSAEDIAKAQKTYESRAIRGFAHDLRAVPDGFFDVLIDSYAAHQYMSREPGVYEASIQEMLRVLRPGGRIIVLGGLAPLVAVQPNLPSTDFRERSLRRLGIPFTPLYRKAAGGQKGSVGTIIRKPC